jgi:YjjI family glycine radical enzyme
VRHDEIREAAREAVTARNLTFRQQLHRLAQIGEGVLDYPKLGAEAEAALASGLVSDLHEGPAPYRPRYVLPDYGRAMVQGSEFLELDPPTNLDEAIDFLSILYHHVPSITTYPVYLGDIDLLLLPYAEDFDDPGLHRRLVRFWRFIDRTIPDAFSHANIGPLDNRVARAVLAVDRELAQVVPNLTLKYDPSLSGDELLLEACRSIAAVNKPHIANHPMMAADHPQGYGVVSCYNTLPLGGGSHTLVRLDLAESGRRHRGDVESYLSETLPAHAALAFEVIRARIRFLVEESGFYEHSFLVKEGLISPDRFTAMFGIYGVAELVEGLLPGSEYGQDPEASELAHRVIESCARLVQEAPMPHCLGERAMLHAQSGISEDVGVTAGARIATGREPDTVAHVLAVAPHHHWFTSGVSDILALDVTAKDNPEALADLTSGAFAQGMREVTFNVAGTDLVRVTGYMVRLSDIEKWRREGSRINSTVLGAESVDNWHLLDRAARVISHETNPWPRR